MDRLRRAAGHVISSSPAAAATARTLVDVASLPPVRRHSGRRMVPLSTRWFLSGFRWLAFGFLYGIQYWFDRSLFKVRVGIDRSRSKVTSTTTRRAGGSTGTCLMRAWSERPSSTSRGWGSSTRNSDLSSTGTLWCVGQHRARSPARGVGARCVAWRTAAEVLGRAREPLSGPRRSVLGEAGIRP